MLLGLVVTAMATLYFFTQVFESDEPSRIIASTVAGCVGIFLTGCFLAAM